LDKSPDAFRTISEVADEIDVPQHVLRFWETRFQQIKPMKRGGGRRYYRPDDVDLLRGVRHLLYGEGYTIRGVQRILREQGAAFVQEVWRAGAKQPAPELDQDGVDDAHDEEVSEPVAATRLEPPSLFASAPQPKESAAPSTPVRREPVLETPAPVAPPSLSADDRRKLQEALDELVACRGVIEAALTQA
jgi:DNA-binding transcriptional MerR regulator